MLTLSQWQQLSEAEKIQQINTYGLMSADLDQEDWELVSAAIPFFEAFIVEAHKIASKRTHYSARTLIEVIRHHSVLEDSDKTFKVNNNITPIVARLATDMFPYLNGLFHMKTRTSRE